MTATAQLLEFLVCSNLQQHTDLYEISMVFASCVVTPRRLTWALFRAQVSMVTNYPPWPSSLLTLFTSCPRNGAAEPNTVFNNFHLLCSELSQRTCGPFVAH